MSALAGIYEELAGVIGTENTYQIYLSMHRQQVTFPQRFYKTEYVKRAIHHEYDGRNCKELAKKYRYSERRIRQMLHCKEK